MILPELSFLSVILTQRRDREGTSEHLTSSISRELPSKLLTGIAEEDYKYTVAERLVVKLADATISESRTEKTISKTFVESSEDAG